MNRSILRTFRNVLFGLSLALQIAAAASGMTGPRESSSPTLQEPESTTSPKQRKPEKRELKRRRAVITMFARLDMSGPQLIR